MVKQTHGVDVPIDNLPLDDAKTYDLLNKANTLGVFQLESGGMRDLCRKFQISSVEHITALIALYRPGPMELIPEFISRRHGEVKIEYEHPLLEPICRETYGIMVYQEQVMQAAQVLAGYTLGGADLLRRAMGKKKLEEMAKQREIFVKGCASVNHIPAAKANQIFDLLEKFAGYGFNKSHAAAYAIVAYQTAYLKANYPVEFFCAMMTNDMADTDEAQRIHQRGARDGHRGAAAGCERKPGALRAGAGQAAQPSPRPRRHPPDATAQDARSCAGHPLRAGGHQGRRGDRGGSHSEGPQGRREVPLAGRPVRAGGRPHREPQGAGGARSSAARAIAWARRAPRSSRRRTGPWRAPPASSPTGSAGRPPCSARWRTAGAGARKRLAALPEWPEHELLAFEKELLGFYVTGHPLTPYAPILQKYALANTATLAQLPARSLTRIGGLIAAVQNGVSKKSGKPYSLVTLEDLEGSVQLLCLNENYDKYRELLTPGKAILVIGEVNIGDDQPKIFPQEIMPLEDAPLRFTKQVHLRLHTAHLKPEHLESVQELVRAHPGKCPLFLCFVKPTGQVIFVETHDQFFVAPSRGLAAGGRRPLRRGDLLREGRHDPAGARPAPVGAARGGERGRGIVWCLTARSALADQSASPLFVLPTTF